MTALEAWRGAFDAVLAAPAGQMGRAARERAFGRFAAHGVPTRRHEYWKYTPVGALTPDAAGAASAASDVFADVDAFRLVFVDGKLDAARSDRDALAAAADVAGPEGAPWMDSVFETIQTAHAKVDRPMADLNLAMFSDGLALRIPAGASLPKPVHLRYEGAAAAHLKVVLLLEAGASATVLESGPGALTTGAEILLQDGASLHHLRSQTEVAGRQFTNMFAQVGANALLNSFTLCADSQLARNETIAHIVGDDANAHVSAAVLGRGDAHIDNTIYVSHEAERCESRQVVKSVLDDSARSVFQGKIFVAPGAQKTDGYQISQAVLLSGQSEFDAKPELEIYADDVKCSHGCTSGALDDDALFYLRARGVDRKTAEGLLVSAFVDEAIDEIADESLQDPIRAAVAVWMAERAEG